MYVESRKNGTAEPVSKAGIEMQMERPDVWMQGGKERAGQTEVGVDMHSPSCVKQLVGSVSVTWGAQLGARWWPGRVGWGRGTEVQEGGHTRVLVAESLHCIERLTQHCKAIIFQLKKKIHAQPRVTRAPFHFHLTAYSFMFDISAHGPFWLNVCMWCLLLSSCSGSLIGPVLFLERLSFLLVYI